jgi:hypothetical protein
MKTNNIAVLAVLVLCFAGTTAAAQTKPPASAKVDVVAVAGCLKETSHDTWMLTNAGDPISSHANAPLPKELESIAKTGKNEYRLTGVTIFNLPAHRNHNVVIKGLLNKATPVSRLNVTSVTMVSAECPAK